MHVVSVINYKGGVGKTTITANLSAELAQRGYNVLMIDLDPQANLTFSFMKPEIWALDYSDARTIKNWFESFENQKIQDLAGLIFSPKKVRKILKNNGRLDLIASHLDLINIDLELAHELGGSSLKQVKKNFLKVHRRLSAGIEKLEEGRYDIIIIDCPPNFNIVTKTAIVASSHLLIPARPDYLSTIGIEYSIRNFKSLLRDYNEYVSMDDEDSEGKISPEILGVIFNMAPMHDGKPIAVSRLHISQTRQMGLPVFEALIGETKDLFSETVQYGVPVALMDSRSSAVKNLVNEIGKFVSEFEVKLGLQKECSHKS